MTTKRVSGLTEKELASRREYMRNWRSKNITKAREYDASYKRKLRASGHPSAERTRALKRSPAYRAKTNDARATPYQREKNRIYAADYRARSRSKPKELARQAINAAVAAGRIVRPDTCQRCGNKPGRGRDGRSLIRADHWRGYDVAHHFDVQWICTRCDGDVERERKAAKR